jgi:hypothetical protein
VVIFVCDVNFIISIGVLMMKMILLASVLLGLGGCAQFPTQIDPNALIQKGEIRHMSRSEVVSAVNECITSDMRPVITKTSTYYNGVFVPNIPVDVTCEISKKTLGEDSFRPQQARGYPVQQTTVIYPPSQNSTGAMAHIVRPLPTDDQQ